MSNAEYQRLLRRSATELRTVLPGDGPGAAEIAALIADVPDDRLAAAVRNLGGHDLGALREAYEAIDDSRPTVIIAYTLKGYGLATEGHPQNHSALLTADQLSELAERLGLDPADPWAGFPLDSPAAGCSRRRRGGCAGRRCPLWTLAVPADLGRTPTGRRPPRPPWAVRCWTSTGRRRRWGSGWSRSARTSARRPTSAAG